MRDVGYGTARLVEGDECRPVVQRRQLGEDSELTFDLVVDHDRIAEAQTAVDDAMRDRVDARGNRLERLDLLGGVVVRDRRELEARRARVDDEDGYAGIVGNSR
jgi:hypothetical protein